MAIDDLIKAVEASGQERIHEIMERSKAEADEIIREAQAKDLPIKKRFMESAADSVAIQKNKMLSAAREEGRMEIITAKNDIFERAFGEAVLNLGSLREKPEYREILKMLLGETLREIGSDGVVLHADTRDGALLKEILNEQNVSVEIVTDITCAGGLNANSRDERFVVFNTLESRLNKAKDLYRPEIFSVLFGG